MTNLATLLYRIGMEIDPGPSSRENLSGSPHENPR
jgi:hypothetical protein